MHGLLLCDSTIFAKVLDATCLRVRIQHALSHIGCAVSTKLKKCTPEGVVAWLLRASKCHLPRQASLATQHYQNSPLVLHIEQLPHVRRTGDRNSMQSVICGATLGWPSRDRAFSEHPPVISTPSVPYTMQHIGCVGCRMQRMQTRIHPHERLSKALLGTLLAAQAAGQVQSLHRSFLQAAAIQALL